MKKPTIEDTVRSLAPYQATVHNLKHAGWSQRQIEAAVRRGSLAWTSDGNLEEMPRNVHEYTILAATHEVCNPHKGSPRDHHHDSDDESPHGQASRLHR